MQLGLEGIKRQSKLQYLTNHIFQISSIAYRTKSIHFMCFSNKHMKSIRTYEQLTVSILYFLETQY